MANMLTGDFDVVAQFAIPAANRVLAAMHRVERFPHSAAVRVEDTGNGGGGGRRPSVISAIDIFGSAVANHRRINNLIPVSAISPSAGTAFFALDPIVNLDTVGVLDEPIVPSELKGRAQLQLFPPTIEVPDGSGTNITVRMQMLARYFPDQGTSPLAEFIRGTLTITVPVTQVASQVGNVVEIDITSANIHVSFAPQWSSRPLSAADLAGINLVIRNALRTSFLPSHSRLPSNVSQMQFKTMRGAVNAIAVLLDLDGGPGNRNSANHVFLGAGDDFALAAGSDYVRSAFQSTIDEILSTPVDPVSFRIDGLVHSWNITYTVVLKSASIELRNDEIVLTIKGRATTPSWPPNFDFTVTQKFSLAASGGAAELVVGSLSLDTSSWIIDRFRGRATTAIGSVRDRALTKSNARRTVRRMLSAEENLGGFLNSLIVPPGPVGSAQPPGFSLAYSSVNIDESGIVLRGSLSAADWPVAHAEFEQIPAGGTGPGGVVTGVFQEPSYSALNSWIPGGTVLRYEWKTQGQTQPGFIEPNKFVYEKPAPGVSAARRFVTVAGYAPLCLTVHGTRLSSSGPVVAQPVSATMCGLSPFSVLDSSFAGEPPMLALAHSDSSGRVKVAGHTRAQKSEAGGVGPNLIVQFGDKRSAAHLEQLFDALRDSGREDAPAAILVVMPEADLSSAPFVEGITYAADDDGLWRRRFGLDATDSSITIIASPAGDIVWRHDGETDTRTLADALRKSLVSSELVDSGIRPPKVRVGRPPPNFLFEHARGRDMTLRKLAGRPAILVFWKISSKQSIEMVREMERTKLDGASPLVLAINDGDPPDAVSATFAKSGISAISVADPERSIAQAYGVSTWPTTITLDSLGLVRAVRHGRTSDEPTPSDPEPEVAGRSAS